MNKTFVAIHDPVHQMLSRITRITRLEVWPSAGNYPLIRYAFELESLPESYYALAAFHSIQGLSVDVALGGRWHVRPEERLGLLARVNYFDALKLDRRCSRDLRLRLQPQGPGMLSADLLAFGIGTLRARNDDRADTMQRTLWQRHGRLHSPQEVSYATIRTLHWASNPKPEKTRKESYDSTNVIYGDVLGELQQLWDRRAESELLDAVCHSLSSLRLACEIGVYADPPLNLPLVLKLHRQAQSLWNRPPSSRRGLLRRIEFLLEHIVLDQKPAILRSPAELAPKPQSTRRRPRQSGSDRSGYDGWLSH